MDKPKNPVSNPPSSSNNNTEYVKQLEDELLKLKIENAYLKELRRLRLEEIPQNKKRESPQPPRILQTNRYSFMHRNRRYHSYKGKVGKVAPNRINRRFETCIPHQKITTDTTQFKYYEIDDRGRVVSSGVEKGGVFRL